MAIISTQDDPSFGTYRERIKQRNVEFKIQDILSENYENFLLKFPNTRDNIRDNMDKVITCGTDDIGWSVFFCSECKKSIRISHTCKSRFCSSCGNKYNESRSISIKSKLLEHTHRHVVFTIPKELRTNFLKQKRKLIFHPEFFSAKQRLHRQYACRFLSHCRAWEFDGLFCVVLP